jgi:MarR family transcriptional regulator, organic hydroperoxide resistance regulator
MSDDSEDFLRLDKQVCFSLYSASNAMVRAYRPILKSLDLTYLQYIAMMVLWEKDDISVSELGEQMNLDSGTLTPLLKRLEAKGLLQRLLSAKDERVKVLTLTEAGKLLKLEAQDIPNKMLCKSALPYEDLVQLKAQCDQLLSSLKASE